MWSIRAKQTVISRSRSAPWSRRRPGGDLFVSIHANASSRKKTRGVEIYFLDENHERHSLDVAARENGVPRSQVDSLQRTLAKLRVSEASRHSSRLAHSVHDSLLPVLSKRYRGLPDLGVKKGPLLRSFSFEHAPRFCSRVVFSLTART